MSHRSMIKRGFMATLCALAVSAALADSPKPIDVPAGDLATALKSLSQQINVNLVYTPEGVRGLKTAGVNGSLNAADAVRKLLEGTGLRLSTDASTGAMLIVSEVQGAGASSSGPAQSDSVGDSIETVNVFGTLENQLSVGSKLGQSLRETPKSVSIVTRERIEEQNLSSLVDVLRQTTGAMTENYSALDSFYYSRGFQVKTMQFDGGAPVFTGGYGMFLVPDMAEYDHVEMLRGVDGMYTGAGDPGGVINLVRKRAKDHFETNLIVSAGRWNFGRIEADVTGPLTKDGRLRGRIVGAFEDKNYFYDRAESNKVMAFGTAEYDLTPTTLLIGGFNYERRKEDNLAVQGFPLYSDGSRIKIPRSTAFNPDWAHWYMTTREAFASLEQKYGEGGVFKVTATHLQQNNDVAQMTLLAWPMGVDPATNLARATGGLSSYDSSQDLLDASFNGTFTLFGREHRYTVGADFSKVDAGPRKGYDAGGYEWPGSLEVPVLNFDPTAYPAPTPSQFGYYPVDKFSQNGYYFTLGLQLAEPVRLTLGGRYGQYRVRQSYWPTDPETGVQIGPEQPTRYNDSKFIPSVSLGWDFLPNWTAYASYAETFVVQANLLKGPMPGSPLDPMVGAGYEVGVKGELLGFLNASAAIYRVERTGEGVFDDSQPFSPGPNGAYCCYLSAGKIITEGLDAEISGTVLPGWQMTAGYTYGSTESNQFYLAQHTIPKHMLKLWTTWNMPGQLSRWTVNLGVLAQSKTWSMGNALPPGSTEPVLTDFVQGGYAVWNASVKYQISERWSVGLFADNIFDKSYYQLVGRAIANNTYGTPRSYVLTLRGRW